MGDITNAAVFDAYRNAPDGILPQLKHLTNGELRIYPVYSYDALVELLSSHSIDVVFARADAPGISWQTLRQWLSITAPKVRFVLMADSDAYAMEAIRLHVHDYLVFPVSDERLWRVLAEA